jgi:hypothetical protein
MDNYVKFGAPTISTYYDMHTEPLLEDWQDNQCCGSVLIIY